MNNPADNRARFAETAGIVEELLRSGTAVRFRVTGSSMQPSILSGDVVTAEPCPPGRIRRGQVICFRHGDEMRVHRVISAGPEKLKARGDAANFFAEDIRIRDVLGIITAVERGGRRVNVNPPFRLFTSLLRRLFRKMTN